MEFNKKGILGRAAAAQQSTAVMDEGLRAYMLRVYNYMGSALLVTGIVALITFKLAVDSLSPLIYSSLGNSIYNS